MTPHPNLSSVRRTFEQARRRALSVGLVSSSLLVHFMLYGAVGCAGRITN